jgi:hypothetical protein
MAANHQTQCFEPAIKTAAIANAIIRPSSSTIKGAVGTRCRPKESTSPEIEEQSVCRNESNKAA